MLVCMYYSHLSVLFNKYLEIEKLSLVATTTMILNCNSTDHLHYHNKNNKKAKIECNL